MPDAGRLGEGERQPVDREDVRALSREDCEELDNDASSTQSSGPAAVQEPAPFTNQSPRAAAARQSSRSTSTPIARRHRRHPQGSRHGQPSPSPVSVREAPSDRLCDGLGVESLGRPEAIEQAEVVQGHEPALVLAERYRPREPGIRTVPAPRPSDPPAVTARSAPAMRSAMSFAPRASVIDSGDRATAAEISRNAGFATPTTTWTSSPSPRLGGQHRQCLHDPKRQTRRIGPARGHEETLGAGRDRPRCPRRTEFPTQGTSGQPSR